MPGNLQQTVGSSPDDDDSGSISVNSEDDQAYDAGAEFIVEDVHCERVDPKDGVLKYLVEWANFPIDECTWEPEDGLPQELRDQWEEKKATQDPSIAAAFEKKYNEAFTQKLEERRQLHRRRNAKRRSLGLPETDFYFRGHYYPDLEDSEDVESVIIVEDTSSESYSESNASSDAEAEQAKEDKEDNTVYHGTKDSVLPLRSSSQMKPQKPVPRPNRIFKTNPNIASEPRAETIARKDTEQSRPQPQQRRKTMSTSSSASLPKGRSTSSLPGRQHELPSTTGYQGSARRSSTTQTKPISRRVGVSATRPGEPSNGAAAIASGPAKKSITAKKSGQAPLSAVNIFTGGRKRQRRQDLGSSMVDTSKRPKFFTRASIRRKAELVSRDNDERPPDPRQVVLFNISQPPPPKQISRQHDDTGGLFVSDSDGPTAQTDAMPSADVRRRGTTASEQKSALSKRSSLSLDGDRPKKKAKSVRFTGEDDQPFVSEPISIDELPGQSTRMRSPAPPPVPRAKLSLAGYLSGNAQSVMKKIVLAPGDKSLDVTFHNIPKDASRKLDHQWLPKFLAADCLRVGYTFLAESLFVQMDLLRKKDQSGRAYDIFCSGTVTLGSGNELDVLAEHLRVGHSGLLVADEPYNFVIYPTKCDGFQAERLGVKPSDSGEAALKYFAFGLPHSVPRLIRPISAITEESPDITVGQEQEAIFRRLLGLRYSRLVAGPLEHKEHHFYLIFPEAAIEWYKALCCWLFSCKPDCKIYTSLDSGAWSAFLGKACNECGVVIIHEAAASTVRRIPRVAESLQTHNIQYWCFSESVDDDGTQHSGPGVSVINHLTPTRLSRMFPWGKAILLTPSFIVSQPQKAYELLGRYLPILAQQSIKLVTAYNIVDYLRDLTNQKSAHQAALQRTRWSKMSSLEVAEEKKFAGLADEDIIALGSAWVCVEYWLSTRLRRNGIFSEENDVIFADISIDPNDEQSLVNWFGWWSLAKAENYRNFFVVGSSPLIENTKIKGSGLPSRACRTISIPKYESCVVNDPDEALRTTMRNTGELVDEGPVLRTARSTLKPEVWFASERYFTNEDAMVGFLSEMDRQVGHPRVYNRPVSWADPAMADHLDSSPPKFATIQQWFEGSFPWQPCYPSNTYLAFFYTIRGDWDPAKFRRGIHPRKHPWLVVYRPVEPHNSTGGYQHGKTELLIWDVRAGDELEDDSQLDLRDLTWMQRELIRFVQIHGAKKDKGSRLERVWLGGFQRHQEDCLSALPIDMTAEFMEGAKADPKWKLPSTEGRLRQKGWRQVSLLETSRPKLHSKDAKSVGQGDVADGPSNDDKDARIIFHPARGSGNIGASGSSKCTNDLYEAARLARLQDSSARRMKYEFRPTMEWYSELVAEGRQYEHVVVNDWEKVFPLLGSKQVRRSRTNLEQNGPARRKSVASSHTGSKDSSPV